MTAPGEKRRPRMGLARQLWLLLLVPMALVLGVYGVLAHEHRERVLLNQARAELTTRVALVEGAVSGAIESGRLDELRTRLERPLLADPMLGVVVFDAELAPILISPRMQQDATKLAVLAARSRDAEGQIEERMDVAGTPLLVRATRLSARSPSAETILVARDLRPVVALTRSLDRWLAATCLALLLLTAIVAEIVSRATIGRPARAIVDGVERVAAGDLDAKVPETGAEEMVRLSHAFNAMTASLLHARERAEREEAGRVAVERRLQHAQALAAIGEVAASLAHEIGSPLNVILGRARRTAEQAGCPAPIRAELDTIAQQSERISRVVARLLKVARPEPRGAQGSDLVQVIHEALAFLGPECRQRHIAAHFEPGNAGSAPVELGADLLFQVVFNLCFNAIEAQEHGGAITVRLLRETSRSSGSRRVAFEVEDRGPGVPRELEERIFEAFFTSKSDRGGTGLGLSIASGIVREAGGSITLARNDERGAVFKVALPADGQRASGTGLRA